MLPLRLACLAAAILVLIAPPAALFTNGTATPSAGLIAAQIAAVLLPAAAFLFVGMNVHRIRRSQARARLCGLALLAPMLVSLLTLWFSTDPAAIWMSGLMLGFTMMLSVALANRLFQLPSPNRLRYRALHQ